MATKLPQALGRDEKQGAQGPDEPGGQGHKGWRQGLRVWGGRWAGLTIFFFLLFSAYLSFHRTLVEFNPLQVAGCGVSLT